MGGSRSSPPPPAQALNQMIKHELLPVKKIGGGIQQSPPSPPPAQALNQMIKHKPPVKKIGKIGGGIQQIPPPPVQQTVNHMEQVNTPPPPAPPTPAEREVTFVQPTEVLVKLRETCRILEKHDNTDKPKKEGYQIYNSDEIVGFNLK